MNEDIKGSLLDADLSKIDKAIDKMRSLSPKTNILTDGDYEINAIPQTLRELKEIETQKKKTPKSKHRYSKQAMRTYLEIRNLSNKNTK